MATFPATVNAEKVKKQILTVLNIDSQGMNMNAVQLGNLVRIEVDKLDTFEVTDRYDVVYLLNKSKVDATNCYGKICLVESGKAINSDKMIGGSIETYNNSIVVTLKLIDVKTETVEKTYIREYLNLPNEIQNIIMVSVREMFNKPNSPELVTQLTKPYNIDNIINNPNKEKLNLSGPRMGFVAFAGKISNILVANKSNGGYELAYPALFQVGYQYEIQYLSEGNFSAICEFVPMISGFDQNTFIPSITIMNGLRNVQNGWELAVGPTFNIVRQARGFYVGNKWYKLDEPESQGITEHGDIVTREDSRGNLRIKSLFVVAVGKTFKSGKLNIPVNIYAIPGVDGFRFGVSFGYNAKKQ
jgi:hypothetical protein